MKIAIIGAGLSGLASAFRLEQLGYKGHIDIYEEKSSVGIGNRYFEFITEVFHRPIPDFFKHLIDTYKLELMPELQIYHSLNYGPTKSSELFGELGYVVARGGHPNALEKQLQAQVKSTIHYNTKVHATALMKHYDHVILASGNLADVPESIPVRIDRYAYFYYASVSGSFDERTVRFWINNRYAMKGYGYLLPSEYGRGMLTLVTADEQFCLPEAWNTFITEQWDNDLRIDSLHEVRSLPIGYPQQLKWNNLILAGNSAGVITPAMGFGLHTAILSGLYAGDSLMGGRDYETAMGKLHKEYQWSLVLRKKLESLSELQQDLLIAGIGTQVGHHLMKPGSVNFLKYAAKLLGLTDSFKPVSYHTQPIAEFRGKTIKEESK